ncbi:hypothetical protein BDW62DRAFT_188138 [Aspergillus aurantiobrunneus]
MNTRTVPGTCPQPSCESTPTDQTKSPQLQAKTFERLSAYQFTADREFATGLAIILGHPETPASEEEITRNDDLVLQAKCYYFTRKENLSSPLSVATYKSWLEARPAVGASVDESREIDSLEKPAPPLPGNTEKALTPTSQEPTYPTSFAHIVELITTGQPVPGVQQIPDTLLVGQGAVSGKPKRLKPWEKEETG